MKIKLAALIAFYIASNFINFNSYVLRLEIHNRLYAQDAKYPFKEYENRKEGILKKEQLVAGEKLLFISATLENTEPPPAGKIPAYNLKFYLADTARVSIEVWEYEKSYKMEPFLRAYPPGLTKFGWPAEIPLYYKIALNLKPA